MLSLYLKLFGPRVKDESGFTLLEYCAGAAVLVAIVYVGLELLGTNLSEFFVGLGQWVSARTPSGG